MVYLLVVISLLSLINCYQDDPFNFGQKLQSLAKSNQLTFLHKQLDKTVNNHTLQVFGLTSMGKYNIYDDYKDKPAIFLNSLFHSRQILSYKFFEKMAQQLIKQSSKPVIKYILQSSVILFMPYVNIDSVLHVQQIIKNNEGSQKSQKKGYEDFRKNMNFGNTQCSNIWQKGVDINRNFDYKFGTQPTSRAKCGEQYHGAQPFSEKQSQAIKQLYEFFSIKISIDVHSFGNVWIYPFASEANEQILKKHKLYPIYQQIFEIFSREQIKHANCYKQLEYLADGVYIDWALSQNSLSFVLQIGESFFDLGPQSIIDKYLNSFMQMLKIMTNNFKVVKTPSNQICITSLSVMTHNLIISNLQNKQEFQLILNSQETQCISIVELLQPNQQSKSSLKSEQENQLRWFSVKIKYTGLDQSYTYNELELVENVDQINSSEEFILIRFWKRSFITKIIMLIGLFGGIGLLCGLSIFCEHSVGIRNADEQKMNLRQTSEKQINTQRSNSSIEQFTKNDEDKNRMQEQEQHQ